MSHRESRPRPQRGARTWVSLLVAGAVAVAVSWFQGHPGTSDPQAGTTVSGSAAGVSTPARSDALPAFLPTEARQTLALIARGGPFPHPQDGGVFGNYEGRLPTQPRGWYHEYTVDTPGLAHRGARRIITGGNPPRAYWYTDDHYASFRPFQAPGP
ncbi:ribonuclease domain-containing protein [Pseudoxanthomonas sp.]|uniref:ribonuclease domain-containing protein n=1 Tax=Pseudoxanthomonas sp. TaxID=1871049 RepID=UPI0031F33659